MTPAPLDPPLGLYPTPLHPLDRFSEALGSSSRIWIKRDDQTGLATGGNKVRKLEFLLADALALGATALITSGGLQSNHCRQTAAAAARLGLRCVLVLTAGALDDRDYRRSGNMLLDRLLGAETVHVEPGADPDDVAADVVTSLEHAGERPYLIPVGGSNALGALGYARCADEIVAAPVELSTVFLATGSGGTQAGLLAGLRRRGDHARVVGVSVAAPAEVQRPRVHELAMATSRLLDATDEQVPAIEEVLVDDRQIGEGYGLPTDGMRAALQLLARTEGILLDPVYTGKAMAGLVQASTDPEEAAAVGPDVLFLHTGGQAGLFAYGEQLADL